MAEKQTADERTYTIGGTSTVQTDEGPVSTFRVANGKLNVRVNMLKHYGHEKIKLIELPRAMTKVDAIAYLITQGFKGVVPTRAADKKAKNELLLAAEAKAERKMKAAATRAARATAASTTRKKERAAA